MKIISKVVAKILALALCVTAVINIGCKCTKGHKVILPPYKEGQLVVWRKPTATDLDWQKKKDDFKAEYGNDLNVTSLCVGCDNTLELWEGTSVQTYISTEVVSGGRSGKIGPSGEDIASYFALNFDIKLPANDSVSTDSIPSYTPIPSPVFNPDTPKIVVAVMDTGDDPSITTNYTTTDIPSCKDPMGKRGFNFLASNDNILDEHIHKHGTVVSSFVVEQVNARAASGGSPVYILPVKIFGPNGAGDLFSVLCAFAYAKNAGAKIINASFGFYYYKDRAGSVVPDILLEYVRKTLTDNNIILVAAAGNRDPDQPTGIRNERDLEKNYFYPGGLADYLPNVFCITTKKQGLDEVSDLQNYSNKIVDIATESDFFGGDRFLNPLKNAGGSPTVAGSSFATPIFTGKLCSRYKDVVSLPINKNDIINRLKPPKIILNDRNPPLDSKIVQGNYIKRVDVH